MTNEYESEKTMKRLLNYYTAAFTIPAVFAAIGLVAILVRWGYYLIYGS